MFILPLSTKASSSECVYVSWAWTSAADSNRRKPNIGARPLGAFITYSSDSTGFWILEQWMIAVSNFIVICQESGHVNSECQRNLFAFQLIGAGYTFFS